MTVRFYKVNDEYGCFSNFSNHDFELEGKYWTTSEHYFQAQKFLQQNLSQKDIMSYSVGKGWDFQQCLL